jgi:amino acid transporter
VNDSPEQLPRALKRTLKYSDLVLYGLAYISPFAPFTTLGFVWKESNGLIVLAYVLGSVCMYFTARSYATMVSTVANAGSVYGFAQFALGPFAGFIAGWLVLLDYLLIPAFCFVSFGIAMNTLLPGTDRTVWIVLVIVLTTLVNWFGIKVTSRANFVAVAIQVIVVVGFVALAYLALRSGKGTGRLTIDPLFTPSALAGAHIFGATSICIMSFLGFDAVSTLSEEVVGGDRRIVARSIIDVLLISSFIFIGVTWVLGNLMSGYNLRDPATAIYDVAAWAIAPWVAQVLAWTNATVVALSTAIPTQVGVARVVYAMGRDRQLPPILAKLHPRHATPYVAMLTTAALSLVIALYFEQSLDELTSIVNFGALSAFLLLHASVLGYFAIKGRSRSWFVHWLVPICGILVVVMVLAGMSASALTVGVAWLVVGVGYGLALKKKRAGKLPAPL